ncbi:MAG: hypothetical protein ABSG43_29160, partial [Solirubrobacteraceae bacterium]
TGTTTTGTGTTPVTAPPTGASAPLPPQGLYEECAPSAGQQCAAELSQMGTAGFQLALNYTAWSGTAAEIQAYATEAQAAGIKLIWPLNASAWRDPSTDTSLLTTYPDLASDSNATTNAQFLLYAIYLVSSLPATWGYYVGDELDPSDSTEVASLASEIRAADPNHPLLYIGAPDDNGDPTPNLTPFLSSVNVIGADVYPIGEGLPLSFVGDVAGDVQQVVQGTGVKTAMVLQAFSWTQYPTELTDPVNPRWPTETEMRQMRNQALTASPSMILWYNLKDIDDSGNATGHWDDLVTAAFGSSSSSGGGSSAKSSSSTSGNGASGGGTSSGGSGNSGSGKTSDGAGSDSGGGTGSATSKSTTGSGSTKGASATKKSTTGKGASATKKSSSAKSASGPIKKSTSAKSASGPAKKGSSTKSASATTKTTPAKKGKGAASGAKSTARTRARASRKRSQTATKAGKSHRAKSKKLTGRRPASKSDRPGSTAKQSK